jgi:hypothetical protein
MEKNKLILNPFAREPSDFYEKDFDKRFTLKKYLLPHLHNMICLTRLPDPTSSASSPSPNLKDFKLSSSDLSKLLIS